MRKGILTVLTMWLLIFFQVNAGADSFVSGSTGADGALAPLADITLQLPTDGVFNFTTVTIPAGVTVKFLRNTANTPVFFLATGDVTIAGTIDVSGETGANGDTGNIAPVPGGKGGPGGFDGGYGGEPASTGIAAKSPGKGLGPGGGSIYNPVDKGCGCSVPLASGGAYSSSGSYQGKNYNCNYCLGSTSTYGYSSLLPLVGGSGGGGGGAGKAYYNYGGGGGGGGGAILIASSDVIDITGAIKANGGIGGSNSSANGGGGGSGGGIRLIANTIKGTGSLQCNGGPGGSGRLLNSSPDVTFDYCGGSGGSGRTRLEGYTVTLSSGNLSPSASVSNPVPVFISNTPTLSITNIAGNAVPLTVAGSYTNPDITLPSGTTNPVSIEIAGLNIPAGTSVTLKTVPQSGAASSTTAALQGTNASSTATASLSISTTSPSVITAEATFTVQTAMYYDGEKIEKVRVAANMGRESEVTYITEKGREVPAEIFMSSLMR